MKITEKVAYLNGLFEGLSIDTDKKEGKILKGMLEVLEELAFIVSDLEDETSALADEVEEIYEEIEAIEEDIYDDEEDEEDEDYELDPQEELYEVICPTCKEEIYLDEGILAEGSIKCPACGEDLEFDFTELNSCQCGENCDCE